ncbi:exonuclease domain-containing protein [Pedobacter antarcticus]|uniref:exonuclease domain-containing protein n=1 Tax=Pedobacter antarcticus TaxID=34086 RepID=UPI00293064DE|nr:exonuclease domain-containing protein [Pedobacter antarcticus]
MLYAVVDIETTGGFAAGNCITEIAIIIHNGEEVVERFETLINPQMDVPLYIQGLTGITDDMVREAPVFTEVAGKIYDLLKDKIFVAHNVSFDYSFVRHQLLHSGFDLQSRKLCTLQLSRRLLPGYSSYSLGRLCDALHIPLIGRHRAGGDAGATAILLAHLLRNDPEEYISLSLQKKSKKQMLPPNLSEKVIEELPYSPGVYYFRDNKGKIIYIGKAASLRKRVISHFTGNNPNRQRQEFLRNIHSIDYTVCGTELMALILEAAEIKHHWPENNRALKRFEQRFGLYAFEDQNGYIRLGIDKLDKQGGALYSFDSLLSGQTMLKGMVSTYQLCEKLCFIQRNRSSCTGLETGNCNGACTGQESAEQYNLRVNHALNHLKTVSPSFILVDKGRDTDEKSFIWVEEGKFTGMGYFSFDTDVKDVSTLRSNLVPYPSNDYVLNLVLKYAEAHPEQKILHLESA